MNYFTTPIYYINGKPHIGHLYTTVAADVISRYFSGSHFQTGTDEHGQKVYDKSVELDIEINEYVDQLAGEWQEFWAANGIEPDHFIRTTDESHKEYVRAALSNLKERGLIYEGSYTGWYDKSEERFWTDKEVVNGIAPNGKTVERVEEVNYFFRLSQYQDQIIKHIEDNPDFIRPESRRNEVLSFLKNPLGDLCISRPKSRLSWGIELPFDSDYVTYVWFDALLNYVSSGTEEFIGNATHLIGKDILIFHAVYWPAILLSLDLPLPKQIFAHGWWKDATGGKIGKSAGNALDPDKLVERYGREELRYLLLRATEFGSDGKFSDELFTRIYNSELANDIGNLANRTIAMVRKFAGSSVPAFHTTDEHTVDFNFLCKLSDLSDEHYVHIERLEFREALEKVVDLAKAGNKYIQETEPWTLKEDKERLETVLRNLLDCIAAIGLLLRPFLPTKSEVLLRSVGAPDGFIQVGNPVSSSGPLFPRL